MNPMLGLRRSLTAAIFSGLATLALASPYDRMIVFGDSLSDNGNLAIVAGPATLASLNYDPRRVTDGLTTTPATSITGVMVEQLNTALGLPPLNPFLSPTGGTNYAWAFAETGTDNLDIATRTTPGTGLQVATYLALNPQASANSLYVLWAGANDLIGATTAAEIVAAEQTAIANLRLQLIGLLSAGAKNILWADLPDLSLTPRGLSSSAEIRQQLHLSSLQFRQDWALTLLQLQFAFPSANITGLDVYAAMQGLISNPSAYGFTNITSPAQGQVGVNPDTYLFWDDLHPTTRVDQLLAQFALQALPVPEVAGSAYAVALLGLVIAWRYRFGRRSTKS